MSQTHFHGCLRSNEPHGLTQSSTASLTQLCVPLTELRFHFTLCSESSESSAFTERGFSFLRSHCFGINPMRLQFSVGFIIISHNWSLCFFVTDQGLLGCQGRQSLFGSLRLSSFLIPRKRYWGLSLPKIMIIFGLRFRNYLHN